MQAQYQGAFPSGKWLGSSWNRQLWSAGTTPWCV